MAKPLYDRATSKPQRLDTPRPLKARRMSGARRRRLGLAATGFAALCVAGAAAWAIRSEKGPGAPSASMSAVSRSAESARKPQGAKPSVESPAPRRADASAPAGPASGGSPAPPPAPIDAEAPRADAAALPAAASAPALLAGIEPPASQPRPVEPSVAPEAAPKAAVATTAAAPLDCVPAELRTVLADVAARFGAVSVVSTSRLNSDNHTLGTTRHNLHTACKAVDFKTAGNLNEVLAHLRSRPEVAGINSYRGGLIHIDLNENSRAAGLRSRARPAVNE